MFFLATPDDHGGPTLSNSESSFILRRFCFILAEEKLLFLKNESPDFYGRLFC
jgi:hypothetical protein